MTKKAKTRYEQILLAASQSGYALQVTDTENNLKNVIKLFKSDMPKLEENTIKIMQTAINNWKII